MATRARHLKGWLGDGFDSLLPALRSQFEFNDWNPGRASGWLYSVGYEQPILPAQTWPDGMKKAGAALLDKLENQFKVKFTAACFQAYENGTGVSWHYDREWDVQAILSLGVTRQLGLKNDKGEQFLKLAHGDLVYMPSGFQYEWEHCVPEEDVEGVRVALVFRSAAAAAASE